MSGVVPISERAGEYLVFDDTRNATIIVTDLQHRRERQPRVERGLEMGCRIAPTKHAEDVNRDARQTSEISNRSDRPASPVPIPRRIPDVDPEFANTEEWWLSIPENVRPSKDQLFYHLLAENAESTYIAYVSEQNLVPDDSGEPISHPQVDEILGESRTATIALANQSKRGRVEAGERRPRST